MKNNSYLLNIAILALIIITVAGFWGLMDNLKQLNNELSSIEISINKISKIGNLREQSAGTAEPAAEAKPAGQTQPQVVTAVSIPTAIAVKTEAQAKDGSLVEATLAIEQAVRQSDNSILLKVEVLTGEGGYAKLDLSKLILIVDPENGITQLPSSIAGSFNSMPPMSSTRGTVIFKLPFPNDKIIIQAGNDLKNTKYYEFNFADETYKEVILG